MKKHLLSGIITASLLGASQSSLAGFIIEGTLTGDNRFPELGELLVDVKIEVGTGASTANNIAAWFIDVDTTNRPDININEFYFNMAGDAADASNINFFDFNPNSWTITSPATTVGGGLFTPNFHFEYSQPPGPPVQPNSISFKMELLTEDFTEAHFLNAPFSTSSDSLVGSGQMGAHLQNANIGGGGDSGFVIGQYNDFNNGITPIPEPASFLLMGVGLLGMLGFKKYKS